MLMKCNECGEGVSDKARTCPHCGAILKQGFVLTIVRKVLDYVKEKRESRVVRVLEKKYEDKRVLFSKVRTYDSVLKLLQSNLDPNTEYRAMLPWMKIQAQSYRSYYNQLLFVSFCMNDEETIQSIISNGKFLAYDLASEFLSDFEVPCSDDYIMGFVKRFISFSQEAREVYTKKIDWSRIVVSHDMDSIKWYEAHGVKIVLGDRGGKPKVPNHIRTSWGHVIHNFSSALSDAVEENDMQEVSFLLRYGANPNVKLCSITDFNGASPKKIHIENPDADIVPMIKSRDVFELLLDAGLRCSSETRRKWMGSK